MATSPTPNEEQAVKQPRDAAYWAAYVSQLQVSHVPTGALDLNVTGKQVVGPLQGFGKMWQKTYRVTLKGAPVTPVEVIKTWKENFPRFWPSGNRFYKPLTGIAPGEVALLSLAMPGGMALSTGVLVIYADDESFTLMTPQGHILAGWITFSSYKENDEVIAQAQLLIRANDPLYEIGLRFGGHKQENVFWQHTLKALAAEFGVNEPVQTELICVDPRLQWSQAKNIWYNAGMRTAIYRMSAPIRWLRGRKR